MNNKNTSDFIAATMVSVLDSTDHQQLFSGQYKTAASKCKDCQKAMDKCMCSMADDSDSDDFESDETEMLYEEPESYLEGDFFADDEELSATAAFDVAIEGLLTASAALDAVDMNHSSELSLKLASLVVQAKKIKEEEKSVKSTKSTKSKKPAPAKKKLTSKDFKKMLKEDDDGKLTATNFKKMRSASSKYTFSKFSESTSDFDYGPQISVDRDAAPLGQAYTLTDADATVTEDTEGNQKMDFVGPALIAGKPYPPVSTNLQKLLGVKVDGKLGPETKNAIFKAKRDRGYPLSMSDKELEKKLSEPFDPYEDFK